MKKILYSLLVTTLLCSCIDGDYDLSDIDTGNVTIGDEFRLPLASISIGSGELTNNGIDIQQLLAEVDTWVPSELPGGVNYVDIQALSDDSQYRDTLIDLTIDQALADDARLRAITDLVWDKYRVRFENLLSLPGSGDETLFRQAFETAFRSNANSAVRDQVKTVASEYLSTLDIEQVGYDIGAIDISSDVVDMLADNLDPEETSNPTSTLHLYGKVSGTLPVDFLLEPALTPTRISFDVAVESGRANEIAEVRLFAEDLRQIVEGVSIELPVTLKKYYPGTGVTPDQQVIIDLRLVKRGGLKLNL